MHQPAYQTQDSGNVDGVLTRRIGHGISATAAAATAGSRHGEGQKVGISTNIKQKKKKIRSWHHFLFIPAKYYVCLLCTLALSIPCWVSVRAKFLKNPKPENPGNYHGMHLVYLTSWCLVVMYSNTEYFQIKWRLYVVGVGRWYHCADNIVCSASHLCDFHQSEVVAV